ncbi:MAG: PhnD/SsuA/transferrin family substrate-binding protein [Chromatiales bacterium]|nr:PhnD/SsuA/transferrin family substrate-binding protein [Chromatiales bacterium]
MRVRMDCNWTNRLTGSWNNRNRLFWCEKLSSVILIFLTALSPLNSTADHATQVIANKTVSIGILAFRGVEQAQNTWQPTIDYLSANIDQVQFKMLPLDLTQMEQAVKSRSVDFILTNPGNYVDLEYRFGASRIATIQNTHDTDPRSAIRSALIVRADRTELQEINDLAGNSLMAVSPEAFGGYQVIWREMRRHGLEPERDLSEIQFAGFPQDNIIKAVLSGEVDAGVIRNCLLEKMAGTGEIELTSIRVLHADTYEQPDCLASSMAYPDWPFAKLTHSSDHLAKLIAQTLLALPEGHPATVAGHYASWTIPVDYQTVHDLFRELRIGPYEWMNHTTIRDIWEKYWQWALLIFLGMIWWLWHVYRVELLVRVRTAQLSESNDRLKHEMRVRQQTEEKLRLQQDELAHVDRVSIAGELASGLAHELNQPLSAISSYAQGCAWRLDAGKMTLEEFRDINQRISNQAERAGAIIERLRTFLRKDDTACTDINLNSAVQEATALFASEAKKYRVIVTLELAAKLPPVCTENIQIQQVIINLLRNGADAMSNTPEAQRVLEVRTYTEQGYVCIAVKDSGEGISDEHKARLFDPFFTTKSEGMGLGLSLSQSIIASNHGRIQVESKHGQGTTFTIEMPIYRGAAEHDD